MRIVIRILLIIFGVLGWVGASEAQPTLGSSATFKVATSLSTNIALPNVDTGNAIAVVITQTSDTAVASYTLTDECGHTYGSPVVSSAQYTTGRAVASWVVYSSICTDTSLVISVTQGAASFRSHQINAFEIVGSVAADTSSSSDNSATLTHNASLDATVIDTAVNVFVYSACVTNSTGFGTVTATAGWTEFTDSSTQVMSQWRTSAGALSNERGAITSTNSVPSDCVIVSVKTVAAPTAGDVHAVCAAGDSSCGGDFNYATIALAQAAAADGDTVCLKAGETFSQATVTAPAGKALTYRSCAADSVLPAPGVRITPAYNAHLPIWKSSQNNTPAVNLATSAAGHTFKFIRFQFDPLHTQDAIRLGFNDSTQQFESEQPEDITLDQIIVEGDPIKGGKRGVSLHGANLIVKNSYFTKLNSVGVDGQCIFGANGTGPYTITNNYCDGTTESLIFGGTDNQMRTTATCASSPAPTTTGCTLENYRVGHTIATLAVNQVIAIQIGAAAREHVRAATINGNVVTWTPALTAAPTEANCGVVCDVRWGVMPSDVLIERNHFTRPSGYWLPPLSTPTNVSLTTSNASGSLAVGEYCYRVNAVAPGYAGANSFSTASAELCTTLDVVGQVVISWTAVTNATKYRVYGRSRNGYTMYWEVTAPTVTYTDTGAAGTVATGVPGGTTWQVKNSFEWKFGNRVTVRHNIFENVRSSTHGDGTLVWLKSGNSDNSGEFNETNDFTFEYNVLRHGAGCIKFSSAEEGGTNLERPSPITGMVVRHNLCYDTGPHWTYNGASTWISAVSDYGLAMKDFTFANNTMFGVRYALNFQANPLQGSNVLRDNVWPSTSNGVDVAGFNPGSATLTAMNVGTFTNNLIAGITLSAYPATTLTTTQALLQDAFRNYGGSDILDYAWKEGSSYLTAASDGGILGADVVSLAAFVSGVEQGIPTGAPIFLTTSLPNGTDNTPYNATILTTGGTGTHTFTLESGTLPTGVSLVTSGSTGVLSGTPTTPGDYTFEITATDTELQETTQSYTVTIAAEDIGTLTITTSTLPDSTVLSLYSQPISALGGTQAYAWEISSGTLPLGWAISSTTGVISGRAQITGVAIFTVKVTSGVLSDTQDFTVSITSDGGSTGPVEARRQRVSSGQEIRTFLREDCSLITTDADKVNVGDLCLDPNITIWRVTDTSPVVTLRDIRLPSSRLTVTVDGATTFAVTTSTHIVLACTGAETINTITGGVEGMRLLIEHVDTDCTLADDDSVTATDAVDLRGTATNNVGSANELVEVIYNGTHWIQTP